MRHVFKERIRRCLEKLGFFEAVFAVIVWPWRGETQGLGCCSMWDNELDWVVMAHIYSLSFAFFGAEHGKRTLCTYVCILVLAPLRNESAKPHFMMRWKELREEPGVGWISMASENGLDYRPNI